MKPYILIIALITMVMSYWLFGNSTPTPSIQKKATAKQEVNNIAPNRVFANMPNSVFRNKAVKTAKIDINSNAKAVRNSDTKQTKPEPQLGASAHERDRAEAMNEEAATKGAAESIQEQLPEDWGNMTQAALNEPDPALRGEAIQTLSLYRNKEVVGVLTEASFVDPDAFNRAKAVQALWKAAADDPKAMVDIKSQLEKSSNDPDPAVAMLAAKAVADLDKLIKQRSQLN